MYQTQALKNMFTELSNPKEHNGLTRKAEVFFNTQAHFNKWLKELTIDEATHLREMLVMFHEEEAEKLMEQKMKQIDVAICEIQYKDERTSNLSRIAVSEALQSLTF